MLKKITLTTMLTILCATTWAQAPVAAQAEAPSLKHVILFIGDGMQLEHERATSIYFTGDDNNLVFHSFPYQTCVSTWDVDTYNKYAWWLNKPAYDPESFDGTVGYDPERGGKQTYPLDKSGSDAYFLTPLFPYGELGHAGTPATDSASSATAMATGQKTDKGNISWAMGDPEDGAIPTIAERFRNELGAAIGAVSTVQFSHATPAAFVSHNVSRGNYYTGCEGYEGLGIADEIINETKPDVVISGGHPLWNNPSFDPEEGNISKDLYEELKTSEDYVFVERIAGQDGAQALDAAADEAVAGQKRLFGLFGGERGCFDPAVVENAPGEPAWHTGSEENPSFEDIVMAAVRVLSQDEDGFFLIAEQGDIDWANHANNYSWMVGATHDLDRAVSAASDFVDQPGDDITWDNTLIMVTADHSNSHLRLIAEDKLGKGILPHQEANSGESEGSSYGGDNVYPDGEVTYGTGGHTNEPVRLYAKGAAAALFEQYEGAWYPGTRIVDNTNIFDVMAQAAGLTAK